MLQEAVVERESKRGMSSWCRENKIVFSDSVVGIISHCTQREACEFRLNTNPRKWSFTSLGSCIGGSNASEHEVTRRSTFNPSPVSEPELWRECQQMHGNNVLCCQRGCSSALFSHANQRVLQGPSSLHRLNAWKQGQGKKVSHETGGAKVLLLLVP